MKSICCLLLASTASAWVKPQIYTSPLTVRSGFFDGFKMPSPPTPSSSSSGGGYVPEGMSEAEYNAAKSADAAKRQASRSKKRGSQMTLDDAKRNGVRHYTQLKGDAVNLEPKKNWLNPFADE